MPRRKLILSIFACLLALFMLAGAVGCAEEEQDIVETADDDDRFDTLVDAIEAADLDGTLTGEGPYTVFAPTDDAFNDLPPGTLDSLLEDIPTLRDILLYHVVQGEVTAADVLGLTTATTVQGQPLTITVEDSTVSINEAEVIETDIECSNGIIHVIDAVLVPPAA